MNENNDAVRAAKVPDDVRRLGPLWVKQLIHDVQARRNRASENLLLINPDGAYAAQHQMLIEVADRMLAAAQPVAASSPVQAQPVAVPAVAPDWPYCNPACDYEDPNGGQHDCRSENCSCEAAKASIARQRACAAAPTEPAQQPGDVRDGIRWPAGYCTDPNGVIIPPAGKHEDYSFGYNIGYAEGLVAIRDSVKAIEARVEARHAAAIAAARPSAVPDDIAAAIHYPACWDVVAYPTVADVLSAVYDHFKCSECAPAYTEDLMDIVRTLVCMADRIAELTDEQREFYPSPLSDMSPLMQAARRACVERGFTDGGLSIGHAPDRSAK